MEPSFPAGSFMLASIIIPVYGQTDMTLRCLEALAASRESSSLLHGASRGENQAVPEVLLINNGAQDFPAEGIVRCRRRI